MREARDRQLRVLSIDPHPRGFGYAVFEGPARLVDWGTKDVRKDKEQTALHKLEELVRVYRPAVIVVEDCGHGKSRRNTRVRRLTGSILVAAREFGVEGRALPRAAVYRAFAATGAGTKYGIATALVRAFPELMVRLPPKRKPWQSEDSRMSIFGAVALGLAYFRKLRWAGTARSPEANSRKADHHA
jgi:Holliday junction resolvasome RuvABC endonuclease subunit